MAESKDLTKLAEWKRLVMTRDSNSCINCEKRNHLAVSFVIPPEVGGRLIVSNGVTICRDCKMGAESSRTLPSRIDNKTPINFLISRKLYDASVSFVNEPGGYGTLSVLIRNMIAAFIAAPEQFEDLNLFQDSGSDVKINLWCPGHQYESFKAICRTREISFTDAFKALLLVAVSRDKAPNIEAFH